MNTSLRARQQRLSGLMLRDQVRLRRRLDDARDPTALARVDREIDAAEARVARRRASVPAVTYPPLPVADRREELLAAIRDHQVVIVAGETGSGKTTQLPKMLLELGRGVTGMIGHTQPRRIAARAVAERIAEELGQEVGGTVGYQVRFTDRVGDGTLVKLMTDGVLLAEIARDRMLRQYDTIVVDEAHERSLNIDFLLGYLTSILPRRPDLKVVITSATIDTKRFAEHFGGAPVVEVSGRSYPVEVRYAPLVREGDTQERDQAQAVRDAVTELLAEGPGDVLAFFSGEREIRDAADALAGLAAPRGEQVEVLPLYGRLSAAEQHRVFTSHRGRRVVLATNVAETSLTVPGIRYVVDPGTARISRYSTRTKVQRLPIEAISQASANQRAGRCGRVADGVCIRLYSEEDFLGRPEFTEPEILRTSLAAVILRMTALGIGEIADFPFLEPPDRRAVRDGLELLNELGALAETPGRLTKVGRVLAQLPVDPRFGRMIVEAGPQGCVREAVVIAAALSIQDPRERPADRQQAADQLHARFAEKESDFLSALNLWQYLREQQQTSSSSRFRRMCKAEYLNYLRVREWQDLYGQLRTAAAQAGLTVDEDATADPRAVHRAVLAGLLSHIGVKDVREAGAKGPRRGAEYLGARGTKFAIFPGSALAKRQPRWVVAAELVETSRLFARQVARIEPEWVEPLAAHLVVRTYSEPRWSPERAAAVATERVTLYGVPIVVGRTVDYGRIDPGLSRELFLREALVGGDWRTHHAFLARNAALLDDVAALEDRARRRDIAVDPEALYAFYDARVPADVVSGRHFDGWWKKARRATPDLLDFDPAMLVNAGTAAGLGADAYPDVWRQGDAALPLSYRFAPGEPDDGVTAEVPLALLNRVDPAGFEWQVPGLREELVVALLRSLPKALRVSFVPAPDVARSVLASVSAGSEPLLDALERALVRRTGVTVPREAWDWSRVPAHLRTTFRVVGENGRVLAEGKDLALLAHSLRARVAKEVSAAAGGLERSGLRDFDLDTLPRTFSVDRPGGAVRGYPALVDAGDVVDVRVLGSPDEQRAAMWAGTRRLLLLTVPSPVPFVQRYLTNATKLALAANPHGSTAALFADCAAAAVDRLVAQAGGPAWDARSFGALREAVRAELNAATEEVVAVVADVLSAYRDAERALRAVTAPALLASAADVRGQLDALVYPGFVVATGWSRLRDLVRYLRAVSRRLERLPADPVRDRARTADIAVVADEYRAALAALPPGRPPGEDLAEVRWMIEELRVSYFAQQLGTRRPVSEQRVLRALDAAR